MNARAVGLQLVFELLLNRVVVAPLFHVDEIDHDQTRQIAQTHLARDLFGRLKVGLQGSLLNRAFLRGATRVHVDRNQSFRRINHDIAARGQLHGRVEHA